MNILVTGGAGFLGRYICRELKSKGHNVFSFSRNHYDHLDAIDVETKKGSLLNIPDLEYALEDIDAVIHTAAIAGVWGKKEDFYNTNYVGTQNLVDACLKHKIKYFINTSSPSVVFGQEDILGADESIAYPKKYLTHYAHTKAMAEQYVMSKCSDNFFALSLRPHLIFGKDDPHIIPRLVESARANRLKVVGDGQNLVDVIHVENAAHAHVLALEELVQNKNISGNCYFIGQDEPVNLWNFINDILVLKGQEAVVDSISFPRAYKLGAFLEFVYKMIGIYKPEPPMTRFVATQLAKNHYFSHNKAKKDFGYKCTLGTKEALKTIV